MPKLKGRKPGISTSERPAPERVAYDIDEASLSTGLSRAFLYLLMKDGRLRFVKIGSRRLIQPEDLRTLIENHVVSRAA